MEHKCPPLEMVRSPYSRRVLKEWATTRGQEARLEVGLNEMRKLRWMCGVTWHGHQSDEDER